MTVELVWRDAYEDPPKEQGIYLVSVLYPGYTRRTDRYDVKMAEYYIDSRRLGRWKNVPGRVQYWAQVKPVIEE